MATVALQPMRSPLEGLARVMAIKEAQVRQRQALEAEKEKAALRRAIASGDWNAVMSIDPQLGAWGQDRAREDARKRAMANLVEGRLPPNQTVPLSPVPGAAGEPMLTRKEILPSPMQDLTTQDPDFVWKILAAQEAERAKPPAAYPSSRYLVGKEGQPVESPVYEPEGYGPIEARQGYIGQTNRKTGKFEKIGEVKEPKKGDLWTPPYEIKPGSGVLVQRNTETGKIVKVTTEETDTDKDKALALFSALQEKAKQKLALSKAMANAEAEAIGDRQSAAALERLQAQVDLIDRTIGEITNQIMSYYETGVISDEDFLAQGFRVPEKGKKAQGGTYNWRDYQ